jgi:hypothetical protein
MVQRRCLAEVGEGVVQGVLAFLLGPEAALAALSRLAGKRIGHPEVQVQVSPRLRTLPLMAPRCGDIDAPTEAERGQMAGGLHTELLAVVDEAMQPTQAALWLRQGPSNGLAAAVGPGTHHQEQAT